MPNSWQWLEGRCTVNFSKTLRKFPLGRSGYRYTGYSRHVLTNRRWSTILDVKALQWQSNVIIEDHQYLCDSYLQDARLQKVSVEVDQVWLEFSSLYIAPPFQLYFLSGERNQARYEWRQTLLLQWMSAFFLIVISRLITCAKSELSMSSRNIDGVPGWVRM